MLIKSPRKNGAECPMGTDNSKRRLCHFFVGFLKSQLIFFFFFLDTLSFIKAQEEKDRHKNIKGIRYYFILTVSLSSTVFLSLSHSLSVFFFITFSLFSWTKLFMLKTGKNKLRFWGLDLQFSLFFFLVCVFQVLMQGGVLTLYWSKKKKTHEKLTPRAMIRLGEVGRLEIKSVNDWGLLHEAFIFTAMCVHTHRRVSRVWTP